MSTLHKVYLVCKLRQHADPYLWLDQAGGWVSREEQGLGYADPQPAWAEAAKHDGAVVWAVLRWMD